MVASVDTVASHEPWNLANKWHKALIHPPCYLTRIGHSLVTTYCCIHQVAPFCLFCLVIHATLRLAFSTLVKDGYVFLLRVQESISSMTNQVFQFPLSE